MSPSKTVHHLLYGGGNNGRFVFSTLTYSLRILCTNKKHEPISKQTGQLPSLHGPIHEICDREAPERTHLLIKTHQTLGLHPSIGSKATGVIRHVSFGTVSKLQRNLHYPRSTRLFSEVYVKDDIGSNP